jgi:hypothetical protein
LKRTAYFNTVTHNYFYPGDGRIPASMYNSRGKPIPVPNPEIDKQRYEVAVAFEKSKSKKALGVSKKSGATLNIFQSSEERCKEIIRKLQVSPNYPMYFNVQKRSLHTPSKEPIVAELYHLEYLDKDGKINCFQF